MCPRKHCSDFTGISENLDRVPAHPIDVEGDAINGIHRYFWPQRIPEIPKELLWLLSVICLLYRSNLFLGFMCQGVFGSQLEPGGAYASWGINLPGWSGSPQGGLVHVVRPSCFCLVPLSRGKRLLLAGPPAVVILQAGQNTQ